MIKQWCKENCATYGYKDMVKTLARYVGHADGSTLTKVDKKAVRKMYEANPEILNLLCNAFEEQGYDRF